MHLLFRVAVILTIALGLGGGCARHDGRSVAQAVDDTVKGH